ncbi:hypothetical protein [Paractinoplanes hotanensis]|uniref:Uncharacterized protein n=1 Tax=Paractinoplanes hotanensis TaxID=2906497 RepID=A0ABT0Y1I4_9ACTN|nr:hypothetical protein [Actinoplanes hotanensis]MCM4079888.1 hypothetical protein [Actinoplanes hotanensis]
MLRPGCWLRFCRPNSSWSCGWNCDPSWPTPRSRTRSRRIRAVHDNIGAYARVDPGGQAFRDLLRQEFEILGVAFPEALFA